MVQQKLTYLNASLKSYRVDRKICESRFRYKLPLVDFTADQADSGGHSGIARFRSLLTRF